MPLKAAAMQNLLGFTYYCFDRDFEVPVGSAMARGNQDLNFLKECLSVVSTKIP